MVFGGDLAKEQEQRDHHHDVQDRGTVRVTVERQQDASEVDRGGDVDQLVAAKNRDDQPPGLVEQPPDHLFFGVSFAAQALQRGLGDREQRSLRGREERRPAKQQDLES
jgi:hypothetical protein